MFFFFGLKGYPTAATAGPRSSSLRFGTFSMLLRSGPTPTFREKPAVWRTAGWVLRVFHQCYQQEILLHLLLLFPQLAVHKNTKNKNGNAASIFYVLVTVGITKSLCLPGGCPAVALRNQLSIDSLPKYPLVLS